ncbi:MAG: acyl-CoA desaturase [Solirubrobacteraceae bacterium]
MRPSPDRPLPPADSVLLEHETADRLMNAAVVIVPIALLIWAIRLAWGGVLHWQDLLVLAVLYVLTGAGVTVGYHRLFTHRSFKTSPLLRGVFAILGSAAIEGSVVEWVATHRKHHRFSDQLGDPHSPHLEPGTGLLGALRGLYHAHFGWTVRGGDRASVQRYAKDLIADPVVSFVSRTFLLWALIGLAVPFGLGVALTGTVVGGLTALLWGGAVRIFLLHHVTFSINSLCHFFGRRRFATGDESRNLAWLAPLSLGESWHNNHHAFPTSAAHGMTRWQFDASAGIIGAMERLGWAWDVVRISPERQAAKLVA